MTEATEPVGYVLIANAEAGTAERTSVEQAERVLVRHAPLDTVWTSSPEELRSVLEDIDERTVVIAGGDGSIHLLVNQMDEMALLDAGASGSVPVGILPLGTGNDLARGLGLPLDPVDAARRIVAGRARPLPLLRLSTGELASNNAHLGLGVDAAVRAASFKPTLGRLAYTVGAVLAGLRHESTMVRVEVDGRLIHDGRAAVVFVALGPSAGGGHEVSGDVDPFDPVADLFVVTATSLGARLRLPPHLAKGDLGAASSVLVDRGSAVAVTVDAGAEAEVDGEFRSWSGEVSLNVEPDAWRVIL